MNPAVTFEPLWTAIVSGTVTHGRGLIGNLVPIKDSLDSFKVHCGGFTLEVQPKLGRIIADKTPVAAMNAPCSLKWFRRMEITVGTKDKNSASPECLWYGLGLEHNGKSIGYRIASDGTATWGGLD